MNTFLKRNAGAVDLAYHFTVRCGHRAIDPSAARYVWRVGQWRFFDGKAVTVRLELHQFKAYRRRHPHEPPNLAVVGFEDLLITAYWDDWRLVAWPPSVGDVIDLGGAR